MKVRIREAAKKFKNWSPYRLAKVLDISQQTVYSWVRGRTQPSYENMDKICTVLGCKVEDILETEDVSN